MTRARPSFQTHFKFDGIPTLFSLGVLIGPTDPFYPFSPEKTSNVNSNSKHTQTTDRQKQEVTDTNIHQPPHLLLLVTN